MSGDFHDWSITEMFKPVWLTTDICTCAEGVEKPDAASLSIDLATSNSFGSGGHPCTRAAFGTLADILLNERQVFRQNEFNGPALLDIDSGTGLLSIFTKLVNPQITTVSVVAEEDKLVVKENAAMNGVELDHVVTFDQFSKKSYLFYHEKFFNVIVTQRGQERSGVTPHDAFSSLNKLLGIFGRLIYSGYPPQEHSYTRHVFGEFFEIRSVGMVQTWPVLMGEPRVIASPASENEREDAV